MRKETAKLKLPLSIRIKTLQKNDLRLSNINLTTIPSCIMILENLYTLSLCFNEISDLSYLSNLSNLGYLFLNDNEIIDISPLSNLVKLQCLILSNNK